MAYAKLFPFGDERADYRSALQTFWLRAAWLEEDDGKQPVDFMPSFDNAPPKTDAQLILDEIGELI